MCVGRAPLSLWRPHACSRARARQDDMGGSHEYPAMARHGRRGARPGSGRRPPPRRRRASRSSPLPTPEVDALIGEALPAHFARDYEAAEGLYRRALARARTLGDKPGESKALFQLGVNESNRKRYPAAIGLFEQSVAIDTDTGDLAGVAQARLNIAQAHDLAGHEEPARAAYRRALQDCKRLGAANLTALALAAAGRLEVRLGHTDRARGLLEEAYAVAGRSGDTAARVRAAEALYDLAIVTGDRAAASRMAEEGLRLSALTDDALAKARALHNYGMELGEGGRWEDAVPYLERAVQAQRAAGDRVTLASALHGLGVALMRTGAFGEARAAHEEEFQLCEEAGEHAGLGQASHQLGRVAQKAGERGAARAHFEAAAGYFGVAGALAHRAESLAHAAWCRYDGGDVEGALVQWAEAWPQFETGSPLREIHGQDIGRVRWQKGGEAFAQLLEQLGIPGETFGADARG